MAENFITVLPGEEIRGAFYDAGEVISVGNGATLENVTVSAHAGSLTLDAGVIVSGTLTVGAETTLKGAIDIDEATLAWDITQRQEEDELLWSDLAAAAAKSYTITVSPNQDKGTYRIAGNAAAFDKTISIQNAAGAELGTLSMTSAVLDYDITRYTLALNDAGELTLTISSNITDDSYFVFLYKENKLVAPQEEGFDLTINGSDEYDHLVVIDGGVAGNIALQDNGIITAYAGAVIVGVDQSAKGKLRFDYSAGDSTIISGYNQYGSFVVEGDLLENVVGENVNLSGKVTVKDYHSLGAFSAINGVDISGVFVSQSSAYFNKGTVIHDAQLSGSGLNFAAGITVTDSTISSGTFRGGSYTNVTIGGGYFYGGSFGNVTLSSGTFYGYTNLTGTLTVNGNLNLYALIDAAGNIIELDYRKRKTTDGAIMDGYYVSEDALFYLDLLADQGIGTYNILGSRDLRSKYSFTIRTEEGILGTLTHENTSFEYGNYVYTMTSGQELAIDISENADETFNVLWWTADGTFGHAAEVFDVTVSAAEYKQMIVRTNYRTSGIEGNVTYGIVGDITLDNGGILQVNKDAIAISIDQYGSGALRFDYAAGDYTLISGYNQHGTFFVENDTLLNVIGENVNLSGEVTVQNYYSTGTFTAKDGVALTGTLSFGSKDAVFSGTEMAVNITNADITGSRITFKKGVNVSDSTISSATFEGGTYTNVIIGGGIYAGGTYNNVTLKGGTVYSNGVMTLTGTLTVTGNLGFYWNSNIDANYNTIVLDYTDRTVTSGAIISVSNVSEEVTFQINLRDDQNVGTYTIASNSPNFIDVFNISIDGEIIGTLKNDSNTFEYGNYVYSMFIGGDKKDLLQLKIDVSENADERFNVLCYDSNDYLSYAPEMTTITVDGTNVARVTVRSGGNLANASLQNGLLAVRSGGCVYGLDQAANGKLRFDYTAGDSTLISGYNQYGTFFVENDVLENVVGENVTVTGDVTVTDYHAVGSFKGTGITLNGNFYGNGTLIDSKVNNCTFSGNAAISGDSNVSDTTFGSANFSGGYYENVVVNGQSTLSGGTYCNVTLGGGGSVTGLVRLDGELIIENNVTCSNSYSQKGFIYANGAEVNLRIADREPISSGLINLNQVFDADLCVTIYADQLLGTYTLGTNAQSLGQGDGTGFWDIETNSWLYKNNIQGDLDGIITIRSDEGIELARCTVNGDTEFFGRYNYRVYTDENNELKLRIGWNNRTDVSFAADKNDNDTLATATELSGSGEHNLSSLSIHNSSDVDFYKFTLDRSGTASSCISIDFRQWAGDLEIDLLDSHGNRIAYAHSVTDNETISLKGLAAGVYYLKVFGDNGDTNAYTLNAKLPTRPMLDDPYEHGNSPYDDPHYLGTVSSDTVINGAIGSEKDADFFSFHLERSGTAADSINLTFDPEQGDFDLYIYDIAGNRVLGKSINRSGGSESITLKGFAQGVYLARIVAADGLSVGDYQLSFSIRSGAVNPDIYEKNRNNNTMQRATNFRTLNGKGHTKNENLSIHSPEDVDYFKFKFKENGSADDWISIDYEAEFGDIDIDILDKNGNVVAYSRTAENSDKVSLQGLAAGDYYIKIYGCNGMTNTYDINWNVTNSALIASDSYEGHEPILINQDREITGLTIAKTRKSDETRQDVFEIQLDYAAWDSSKIILTDFRSDWVDGMVWSISSDAAGKDVITSGQGSEISLADFAKGKYFLTVDAPKNNEYSQYSLIAQNIPDGEVEVEKNNWSIFVYLAGDNNLEEAYLQELLWMQQAVLPPGVEVYVLMDRSERYAVAERNWSDTRVGKIVHSPSGAVAVQWIYFEGEDSSTYMNTSNLELRQEWDTGNVATLEAFLDWGMKNGKADNYALIMKDHGTSLGFNSSDETSGSIMNIGEIAALLDKSKYDALKVLAFDQCLMGSDVVITTMEGNVDYVVASESVGYTPNQLVMYKVLFNSLTADMTAQDLAQKIVKACNCSGLLDLTSASFHVADSTLSEALNTFAEAAGSFTRADWVEICKSFALALNYGDSICAYSDLGFMLSAIKNSTRISGSLLDAAETLYDIVIGSVIDSTLITPASYGSGLAVFNPVQSDDLMSAYSYGPGANLDYYGTAIGQAPWGEFLYTVGQLAEDCTEYFVDNATQLTFTDFSYSFVNDEIQVNYNLGEFSGNGVEYNGLYLDDNLYFTITLDNIGVAGDAIRVTADNPDANITISLVQQRPIGLGMIDLITRRVSTDGVLSLEGIDNDNAGVLTEYFLTISTDKETTCNMSFEADWTSGSDYFDYSRSGRQLGRQGNGSISKATVLAAGNYGGLVTYDGDADYYQLKTVYSNEIEATVKGSGLRVYEYDAAGKLLETAQYSDGIYKLTVANGNYLCVEGDGSVADNNVNSYSMEINDAVHTYLAPAAGSGALPKLSVSADNTVDEVRSVEITPETAEGMTTYYSTDLRNWTEFSGSYTACNNNLYYFKAVDPETKLESKYTSVEVNNIDNIAPDAPVAAANVTGMTNQSVVISATFSSDSTVCEYSLDNQTWLVYPEDGVTLKENGCVYFRSFDQAGNCSEVTVYEVSNIDKTAPELPEISADITAVTDRTVHVSAQFSQDSAVREYSFDGQEYFAYTNAVAVEENSTLYFRAADAAGNYTQAITYQVSNIAAVDKYNMTTNSYGYGGNFDGTIAHSTAVTVSGGTFKRFFGGNNINKNRSFVDVSGDVNLFIHGGTFSSIVTGGDYVAGGIVERQGDINFTIRGGEFKNNVGGGLCFFFNNPANIAVATANNINFTIAGGTFHKRICAGNFSAYLNYSSYADVKGDINLTIDASSADITIKEYLVAGSSGYGWVRGNVTVTLKKSADHKIDFNNTISGGSEYAYYTNYSDGRRVATSYVEGERTVVLDDYDGQFNGKLLMFEKIKVTGSTDIEFTNSDLNLSDISTWEIEAGAVLDGIARNNFAADKLILDLSNWDSETPWQVMSGSSNGFIGFASAASVMLDDQQAAYKSELNAWCSTDYKLTVKEDDNGIKRMIVSALEA